MDIIKLILLIPILALKKLFSLSSNKPKEIPPMNEWPILNTNLENSPLGSSTFVKSSAHSIALVWLVPTQAMLSFKFISVVFDARFSKRGGGLMPLLMLSDQLNATQNTAKGKQICPPQVYLPWDFVVTNVIMNVNQHELEVNAQKMGIKLPPNIMVKNAVVFVDASNAKEPVISYIDLPSLSNVHTNYLAAHMVNKSLDGQLPLELTPLMLERPIVLDLVDAVNSQLKEYKEDIPVKKVDLWEQRTEAGNIFYIVDAKTIAE